MQDLQRDALLCVTGSVYLAGIARGVLRDAGDSQRASVSRGGAPVVDT
jgi:hypothetical protein